VEFPAADGHVENRPGLAMGNSMVVKPSELSSLTALRLPNWRSKRACPMACSTW
jgi:acyl-CoA reductase-like NAD-dependent aldehyde dehydrogenase